MGSLMSPNWQCNLQGPYNILFTNLDKNYLINIQAQIQVLGILDLELLYLQAVLFSYLSLVFVS